MVDDLDKDGSLGKDVVRDGSHNIPDMAGPGVSNAGSKPVAIFLSNDPALREAVVLGREDAARHSFRRQGILHAYSCTSTSTCSRVGLGAEGWGGVG